MDRADIEAVVRRLSPWYYRHDLDGVCTDMTPPSDHHGHRTAILPPVAESYLTGSTVLASLKFQTRPRPVRTSSCGTSDFASPPSRSHRSSRTSNFRPRTVEAETDSSSQGRRTAALGFGNREKRVIGGNANVRRQDQFESARQGRAIDDGHDRFS